jgi:hypothetical protein
MKNTILPESLPTIIHFLERDHVFVFRQTAYFLNLDLSTNLIILNEAPYSRL